MKGLLRELNVINEKENWNINGRFFLLILRY